MLGGVLGESSNKNIIGIISIVANVAVATIIIKIQDFSVSILVSVEFTNIVGRKYPTVIPNVFALHAIDVEQNLSFSPNQFPDNFAGPTRNIGDPKASNVQPNITKTKLQFMKHLSQRPNIVKVVAKIIPKRSPFLSKRIERGMLKGIATSIKHRIKQFTVKRD